MLKKWEEWSNYSKWILTMEIWGNINSTNIDTQLEQQPGSASWAGTHCTTWLKSSNKKDRRLNRRPSDGRNHHQLRTQSNMLVRLCTVQTCHWYYCRRSLPFLIHIKNLPPTINSKTKPKLFVDGISIITSYP